MSLSNLNLDDMAKAIHDHSYSKDNKNMIFNPQTGKLQVVPANQPIPREGVVANGMTKEGFAL